MKRSGWLAKYFVVFAGTMMTWASVIQAQERAELGPYEEEIYDTSPMVDKVFEDIPKKKGAFSSLQVAANSKRTSDIDDPEYYEYCYDEIMMALCDPIRDIRARGFPKHGQPVIDQNYTRFRP